MTSRKFYPVLAKITKEIVLATPMILWKCVTVNTFVDYRVVMGDMTSFLTMEMMENNNAVVRGAVMIAFHDDESTKDGNNSGRYSSKFNPFLKAMI